jgi:lysozyme
MKHIILTFLIIINCAFVYAPSKEIDENDFIEYCIQYQKEKVFFYMYNKSLDVLKEFEGLKLVAYGDSWGRSIGYGHFIKPYEKLEVITIEKAEALLRVDFENALQTVEKYTGFNRYDNPEKVLSLAHFVFNFGEGSFANSTMLKNIKQDLPIDTEITRWTKARINGELTVLDSLKRRREYELKLYYS